MTVRAETFLGPAGFGPALSSPSNGSTISWDPTASGRALLEMGTGLVKSGNFKEALPWLNAAVAQCQEDLLAAVCNRAIAMAELGRIDEALGTLGDLLKTRPEYDSARMARAAIRMRLDDHEGAADDYGSVIGNSGKRDGASGEMLAAARLGRSLARLTLGRMREGLEDLELRPRSRPSVLAAATEWNGRSALRGERILAVGGDDLRDNLLHLRYVAILARRASGVIVAVPPALKSLAECIRQDGVSVISEGHPRYGHWVRLSSLPLMLWDDADGIPAPATITLAPALMEAWQLPMRKDRLRVGLGWSANERPGSVPLALLEPLLDIRETDFYALEQPTEDDDRVVFKRANMYDIADKARDLRDLAYVISGLDVVIAADSIIAALSATLGIRTLVMLPRTSARWVWAQKGDGCEWWPAARALRQEIDKDWSGVVGRLRAEIESRGAAKFLTQQKGH